MRRLGTVTLDFGEVDIEEDIRGEIWSTGGEDFVGQLSSKFGIQAAAKRFWIRIERKAASRGPRKSNGRDALIMSGKNCGADCSGKWQLNEDIAANVRA